jgi:hypothetical protein
MELDVICAMIDIHFDTKTIMFLLRIDTDDPTLSIDSGLRWIIVYRIHLLSPLSRM